MKSDFKKWTIVGTIFIILFGFILHFLYEWTSGNRLIGIFSAVNESTWEHLKLLFWPAFFFAIIEYLFIGNKYNNYIYAKAVSFYVGILLIISLFYTYSGVLGENYLVIDIAIFIISVLISQYIGYKITVSDKSVSPVTNFISLIAIVILIFAFVVFTFTPPEIPLFEDPISGNYGIS